MSARAGAAKAVLAVAAVALAGAVVILSQSSPRLAEAGDVRLLGYPVILQPGQTACQTGEPVPGGAVTLELPAAPLEASGPPLEIIVAGETVRVAGGYGDELVEVPLPRGAHGADEVCISNAGDGAVGLGGQDASAAIPPGVALTVDEAPQTAAIRLRWLTTPQSGWAVLDEVTERWGYVTALGGITPYVAMFLLLATVAGALTAVLRGSITAVGCAAIAFASAAGWALTTPVFHVPDEPQHFAYLQRLAESGELPKAVPGPVFSDEEGVLFAEIRFNHVIGNVENGRPPWTEAADRRIDDALERDPGRFTEGGVTNTTNNPPLYYLGGLGAYWAATATGGDLLDRVLALRLWSAVLIALTAAFGFAFLRELLPRAPWAWAAGGVALALQPLLGFIGGGVNNDAGLFAAGAAVFWLVARALRRGLDRRGAVGIGLAFGLGLVTKATIVGLAPGLLLCAAVLVARAQERRAVLGRIGLAAAVAAVPVAAYLVLNSALWDRGLWSGGGTVTTTGTGKSAEVGGFLSYLWQFYLPRLPFMEDQQAGIPLYNVWLKGLVGRYGWLDTGFPSWAYAIAIALFGAMLAAIGRLAWRERRNVRRWGIEALVLGGMAAGFLLVIAWAGYRGRLDSGLVFEQARYLLPLAALYAGVIALTAVAGGRLGRSVAGGLVALACAHALFSLGLVVGRFYA